MDLGRRLILACVIPMPKKLCMKFCCKFQNCREVLEYMCRGYFGKCEAEAKSYQEQCHKLFPFVPSFIVPTSNSEQIVTNGNMSS